MSGGDKINRFFTWRELTKSQTATRRGINNTPNAKARERLRALANNVLLPLRKACGAPLVVTSGYRSPALCAAIGGSKTSRHATGDAADVECFAMSTARLALTAARLRLPLEEIILEFYERGTPNSGWAHLGAWREGERRRAAPQILLAERLKNGKICYLPMSAREVSKLAADDEGRGK